MHDELVEYMKTYTFINRNISSFDMHCKKLCFSHECILFIKLWKTGRKIVVFPRAAYKFLEIYLLTVYSFFNQFCRLGAQCECAGTPFKWNHIFKTVRKIKVYSRIVLWEQWKKSCYPRWSHLKHMEFLVPENLNGCEKLYFTHARTIEKLPKWWKRVLFRYGKLTSCSSPRLSKILKSSNRNAKNWIFTWWIITTFHVCQKNSYTLKLFLRK